MLVEARRWRASAPVEPIRPPLRVHPVPPLRPPDRADGTWEGGALVSGVGHVLQNNQSMSTRQSIGAVWEFFLFLFTCLLFEWFCGSRSLCRNCAQSFWFPFWIQEVCDHLISSPVNQRVQCWVCCFLPLLKTMKHRQHSVRTSYEIDICIYICFFLTFFFYFKTVFLFQAVCPTQFYIED